MRKNILYVLLELPLQGMESAHSKFQNSILN